jgi:predicted dehydrogenase
MKKIRVAIIGVGHLGSKHLKVYNELRDRVEIVAICDVRKDVLLPLSKQYNVPTTDHYQSLIGKIDAVNICTPTVSHFDLGQFFLKNKIHTFIEKPISKTVAEADALIEIAKDHQCKLQVGHVERFNAGFQSILRLTHDPRFIECHRLNQFSPRSLDIGVVMDLMIHDIDIILGLIQSPIKDISAVGVDVLTPHEDIASVRLTFENGCICNLTASRISDEVMRKIRIFQTDTYISLDYVKQEAYIYKKHASQIFKHALPIEKEEPLKKELEHFLDCIENNQTPIVAGEQAREALDVALKISQQLWAHNNHSTSKR